jgi:hypothetical protein
MLYQATFLLTAKVYGYKELLEQAKAMPEQ